MLTWPFVNRPKKWYKIPTKQICSITASGWPGKRPESDFTFIHLSLFLRSMVVRSFNPLCCCLACRLLLEVGCLLVFYLSTLLFWWLRRPLLTYERYMHSWLQLSHCTAAAGTCSVRDNNECQCHPIDVIDKRRRRVYVILD